MLGGRPGRDLRYVCIAKALGLSFMVLDGVEGGNGYLRRGWGEYREGS